MGDPDNDGLRSLPTFELLTRPEAAVFDRHVSSRTYASGEPVEIDDSIVLVRDGSLALELSGDGTPALASIGPGGLVGERRLFDPEPVPLAVRAAATTACLVLSHRDLKHGFHMSRPATVKWLTVFARSLSDKLRSANNLLRATSGAGPPPPPTPLDTVDLDRLKSFSEHKTFSAGERLFGEGDASEELYVIDEGEVDIRRDQSGSGETILAHLGPGEFFGEMAFVDGKPRSAHVVATSDLVAHVLPAGTLDQMAGGSLPVGIYLTDVICKILARRLGTLARRLA